MENVYKIKETEAGVKVCQVIDGWYGETIVDHIPIIIYKLRKKKKVRKRRKEVE